jgi:hypothetical protein
VQFIAVLPVFVLVVIGLWAVFSVYSARDAICDATREAARYLQVEGPLFEEDVFVYPDDWEAEAVKIVDSELRKERLRSLVPVLRDEVMIFPEAKPMAPKDMKEVLVENVPQHWFFVRVTKQITNPLAVFLPEGDPDGPRMTLSCQAAAYFEGPPIGPTGISPPQPPNQCNDILPPCDPGGPPPTSTPCPTGQSCPPTPCPICRD